MRLYYTGAQQYRAVQPQPTAALGGYPSATLVANDSLEAVFESVSPYGRQQGQDQVRCLALLNESPQPASALRVTLEDHPDLATLLGPEGAPVLALEVGLALPNIDHQGNPYFEQVPDGGAAPYYATFGTDVQLGDELEPGQYVGLWLRLRPVRPGQPAASAQAAPAPVPPIPAYLPHLLRFSWSQ
jgi:hypothetical protein